MDRREFLKKFAAASMMTLVSLECSGCFVYGVGTVYYPEGVYSYNPTVIGMLDSFETAALAIALSNSILLETPLSELDEWTSRLQVANLRPSLSLARVDTPFAAAEMDTETGFPRPTSPLYKTLKAHENMLKGLDNKDDIAWFKEQSENVIHREFPGKKLKDGSDAPVVYRNILMAYGAVTKNIEELRKIQELVADAAAGYKSCNDFIHQSTKEMKDEKMIRGFCPDLALKDEDIEKSMKTRMSDKKEEKEAAEKQHGKLAGRVYNAAVSGADFSAAAVTGISSAIVNGIRALPNIRNEFKGIEGAYNMDVIIPRTKNVFKSLGGYKDNLGFQWTVYKTMYQQLKATYDVKDDEQTKQSLQRIKAVEIAMAELEPKLSLALAGEQVLFSDADARRLDVLSVMFPEYRERQGYTG